MVFNLTEIKKRLPHIASSHLWEVQLQGLPYSSLIVSDVKEHIATYNLEVRQVGFFQIPFPANTTLYDISITFYDSHKREVEKFVNNWLNEEAVNKWRVNFFDKFAKDLFIVKYTNVDVKEWKPVYKAHYKVVPNSSIYFEGKSEKLFDQNTLNLIAVKVIRRQYL